MTGPSTSPHLKSPTPATDHRPPAGPAPARGGGGAPKVAAEGVRSGLDPRPGDGRRVVALLHIAAPGRGAVPTATSVCDCGRNRSAIGHRRVAALIAEHAAHRTTCPLRHQPERTAA
ncbi:hypothetical protein LUX12_12485 [Streptomyces somaliensis]|uniref:hypothetical protein n=1 Tax=Streptomyces somaliensis TaxID=78355 RepID=UPI0020CFCD53|nr:hypothetical protein [Streptomyces somaliensis]MCP9945424.1 hypothetical protein [Streptomyces somaliensis]MCP9961378.1 hypothetical protein [Streptomyces somaliensis]MCP9974185.1 hypothetical protein [Streptomyces somaliensis]